MRSEPRQHDYANAFRHRLRVRYHECDSQGLVFNANHLTYVDVALSELWRSTYGSHAALVELGFDVVVVDAHVSFQAPAHFDDELVISLAIERIGRTSMTLTWRSTVNDLAVVHGEIVYVWVDPNTLEPVTVPDHARERLQRYACG